LCIDWLCPDRLIRRILRLQAATERFTIRHAFVLAGPLL